MSVTVGKSRHVKFGDEDASDEVANVSVSRQTTSKDIDDSSDSDDDDAPEEEGLSSGISKVEDEIRLREEAIRREKQELREKRRSADARFKEQQLLNGSKVKVDTPEIEQELPEELSEEFFEKLDQKESSKPIEQVPKHINFNDITENEYLPEIKKQLEKKKKNTLKKLRANTVKRGSFNVTVLNSEQSISTMAPKRESSIMNTKDKWLKRKAIRRR